MSKNNFTLSENENQILNTMWRENCPLTRSEIIELTHDKTWKESSIHILLNQLLEKEAIQVKDIVRTGKSYGRTYIPTISKEDFELMQLRKSFLDISPSENSALNFLSILVNSKHTSDELLEQLELVIQNRKKNQQ